MRKTTGTIELYQITAPAQNVRWGSTRGENTESSIKCLLQKEDVNFRHRFRAAVAIVYENPASHRDFTAFCFRLLYFTDGET